MIAIDDELLAPKAYARVASRFAGFGIDRLVSAELDEQTQQRGNDFFPRENQYSSHDRSK
jgi:hypothetical protein